MKTMSGLNREAILSRRRQKMDAVDGAEMQIADQDGAAAAPGRGQVRKLEE